MVLEMASTDGVATRFIPAFGEEKMSPFKLASGQVSQGRAHRTEEEVLYFSWPGHDVAMASKAILPFRSTKRRRIPVIVFGPDSC